MKKYEACYLPSSSENNLSKSGFNSEQEAWDYASKFFCKECKKDYDKGKGSACDAEWIIDEEEE